VELDNEYRTEACRWIKDAGFRMWTLGSRILLLRSTRSFPWRGCAYSTLHDIACGSRRLYPSEVAR